MLTYLDAVMCEIDLERRFEGEVSKEGIFQNVTMVIDGTDLPIQRPSRSKLDRQVFFSGRKKENARSKYNLKYTVGVQISSGIICFIDGPDPGSKTDVRVLQESELMAEIIDWDPFEIILADKGYEGVPHVLTPFKNPTGDEDAFNQVISSVRQVVECSLRRIKVFGILESRYRKLYKTGTTGGLEIGLEKHQKIFNVCCQITNISIEREPVWQSLNFYLKF
jgi:hypothetical protein